MSKKQRKMLLRIVVCAVATLILLLTHIGSWVGFALWIAVYLLIGYDILWRAARGIFSGQIFDENFLMSVATLGAIALAVVGRGELLEAVAVMLFYQSGELFQSIAVGKSRRSIGALMDIRPDYANVEREGELVRVEPDTLEVGSVIVVNVGERIPIDSTVIDGESYLDTFALTGESVPRGVKVGDEALSGCINMSGRLTLRTVKPFGESAVSRILELVENASSRKAMPEKFITFFARFYTPIVCAAALLLALLPPILSLLTGAEPTWLEWLYRALTFLVISCPCALVISIPLTFFAGLGGAGKHGILIKGSGFIESLAKVDSVALDKTGTLTRGSFDVSSVRAIGLSEEALLEYAALAESASVHPIAKSISVAYGKPIDTGRVSEVSETRGRGVSALVDGVRVCVGSAEFIESCGIALDGEAKNTEGAVHISVDGAYAGYIVISDTLKESSARAVSELRRAGVKRIAMLTGDRRQTAVRVGAEAGIDEIHAELLPDQKLEELEKLKASSRRTVFVGDGINDAPVLSGADVGIAMGAIGSDAALEAADVVIMDDCPEKAALAIRISKKCMRIVYQNIVITMAVKGICLVLGAFGIANMWLAIFADVGVMVIAVLNAIRALSVKTK